MYHVVVILVFSLKVRGENKDFSSLKYDLSVEISQLEMKTS